MRIKCLSSFLDGKERFEADDIRSVDDDRGCRFIANGWAVDAAIGVVAEVSTGGVDLNVHPSTIGTGDSNG